MRLSLKSSTENKFLMIITVVLALALATFFTSKLWLSDDSPINQTNFNESISLDQTEVSLKKWTFNKKDNFMEIVIEKKHTGSDIIKPSFEFLSKEDESNVEIDTEIVYESDTMAVVELKNIPEEFRYIKLAIDEYRDEETVKNESQSNDIESKLKPKRIVLVGDYRTIEVDNSIKTRNKEDYEKENIYIEMQTIEEEIESIQNEKIPLKEKSINQILKDIETLEEEKKFSTDEEIYQLERDIYSKENSIESEEKTIAEYKEKIEQSIKKIESLQSKIDYLDGKPIEKKKDTENQKEEKSKNTSPKKENNDSKKDSNETKEKDKKEKSESKKVND